MTGASNETLTGLSAGIADLVAAASRSVVGVKAGRATVTGFLWREGLIVTADEALDGNTGIRVVAGGASVEASLVGRDPTTDIALLRAEVPGVDSAVLSDAVPGVGTLAVAVGVMDAEPIASLGIVARSGAAWRSMRGGHIDARIELELRLRRAAEGGLALDPEGRVFGMAVFGARRRAIVIPSATIARIAPILERHGGIPRGYLGLRLQAVPTPDAGRGIMVVTVDADGPGAAGDVRQGDVIIAWDGAPVDGVRSLLFELGPESIGRSVSLSVLRGGTQQDLTMTIGERPSA